MTIDDGLGSNYNNRNDLKFDWSKQTNIRTTTNGLGV